MKKSFLALLILTGVSSSHHYFNQGQEGISRGIASDEQASDKDGVVSLMKEDKQVVKKEEKKEEVACKKDEKKVADEVKDKIEDKEDVLKVLFTSFMQQNLQMQEMIRSQMEMNQQLISVLMQRTSMFPSNFESIDRRIPFQYDNLFNPYSTDSFYSYGVSSMPTYSPSLFGKHGNPYQAQAPFHGVELSPSRTPAQSQDIFSVPTFRRDFVYQEGYKIDSDMGFTFQ